MESNEKNWEDNNNFGMGQQFLDDRLIEEQIKNERLRIEAEKEIRLAEIQLERDKWEYEKEQQKREQEHKHFIANERLKLDKEALEHKKHVELEQLRISDPAYKSDVKSSEAYRKLKNREFSWQK